MNRTLRLSLAALVIAASPLAGCDLFEIDDRGNPNGPALDDVIGSPTEANISTLAIGVESTSRFQLNTYLVDVGMIGREYWRISPSDPRFVQDLLGQGNFTLDDNTFYITNPWGARYTTIRNANTMLLALEANQTLSAEEKASARGFAKTWLGYQYLLNLNLTYENGVRFIEPGDVEAGPIIGYDDALDRIAGLLDEGAADLGEREGQFFPTTVDNYLAMNRGLASRVDLYRDDWGGALEAAEASAYLDVAGDLMAGAYHIFSNSTGDISNPFYLPPDSDGDVLLAHPSYVEDIDPADERISKVAEREERSDNGLTSSYGLFVYETPNAPIPIVRNGELVLNRAEARAQTGDLAGAIADVNVIRTAAGLEEYDGAEDFDAVIAEVLRQRRFELYGEGHRWIDVRRYDLLGTLPIDREGDDVFAQFPIPASDTNRP